MKTLPSALALSAALALTSKGENLSPKLEVLPLNSTLSKVTIPRYDNQKRRVAYLKADLMEILADGKPIGDRQPIMVDCTTLQLRMVATPEDEALNNAVRKMGGEIEVDMSKARYRLTSGVLTAQEKITAISPEFTITGIGGVFDLDTRRGFLFGPLQCNIASKNFAQNTTPMISPMTALLATTSLVAFNPSYDPPSTEELLEVERLARSSETEIQAKQVSVAKAARETDRKSREASQKLANFAEDVESNSLTLLIQNPPAPKPPDKPKPPLENPDLMIRCDGGCFFDGNENLLVLLRNVVVNEDRFTLTAQEEIKVFFPNWSGRR